MSVQTQIDRISGAVSAALTALSEKGVTVPAGTKVDGLAALIAAIESGADLSKTQFTKMTCGTITPSQASSSLTINHNLGEIPKVVLFFSEEVDDFNNCSTPCLMSLHSYIFTDSNGTVWNVKQMTGKGNASWTKSSSIGGYVEQGNHLTVTSTYNYGGIIAINTESAAICLRNRSAGFYHYMLPVTYSWFMMA